MLFMIVKEREIIVIRSDKRHVTLENNVNKDDVLSVSRYIKLDIEAK